MYLNMETLIFDIETNGLELEAITKFHCLCIKDVNTGKVSQYYGDTLWDGVSRLEKAEKIVGHNIIGYDVPVIKKFFKKFSPQGEIVDTLLLSRLIFTDVKNTDFEFNKTQNKRKDNRKDYFEPIPGNLIGSHKLETWGYRLGLHKGKFEDWDNFSEEMLEYCERDVEVTAKLYQVELSKEFSQRSIDIEHEVANIIKKQEETGWEFDVQFAQEFSAKLRGEVAEIDRKLKSRFGTWWVNEGVVTAKRNNGPRGYVEGTDRSKVKLVQFNPASRDHIVNRLIKEYNWEPKETTETGKPKVDESILEKLKYPEAKDLARRFLLGKRLGLIADGDKSWLKNERNGRLHGWVITNGAVTGRATHKLVANIPRVGTEYGKECREFFIAAKNKVLVGSDLAGLELRCLGHYLAPYDMGAFSHEAVHGDPHSKNQKTAGLEKRSEAKTLIYLIIYGGGANKAKESLGITFKKAQRLIKIFLESIPGLEDLKTDVIRTSNEVGYLTGLDGRQLHVRSEHSALNTLLQSAGAIISKQWMINVNEELTRRNLHDRVKQVGWFHDELAFECDPEVADEVGELVVEGARKCTEQFNFKCPIDADYKVGDNWSEIH